MDNLVYALIIAVLVVAVVDSIDMVLFLWVFGFILVAFSWNLTTVFGITWASYGGFGRLFILGYWGLTILCFGKAILETRQISKGESA